MSSKKRKKVSPTKWLLLLPAVILLVVCCSSDIWVEPFETTVDTAVDPVVISDTASDPVSEQSSPENPKLAVLAWLDEHSSEYDSYIFGASSCAAYDVEELNGYLNASFFDLSVYDYAPKDYRDFAAYLLERYPVKNIVLNLDMSEAIHYFLEDSGAEDRQEQDVEKIGDPAVYAAAYAQVFPDLAEQLSGTDQLPFISECAQMVADIRDMCEAQGVNLTVIASPIPMSKWNAYDQSALRTYKTILADVVDYWDFSCTPISFDSRYFYDTDHFRGAVGTMVLAEIFGNDTVYRPERFGAFVTAETSQSYLNELFSDLPQPEVDSYTADVPVLLYHHISKNSRNYITVTPETFEDQIRFLMENGYHAVTIQQMIDYVYHGGTLPDKPVCITFDDGYLSNYEYAYPILQKYGMTATVYAIGSSVGHDRFYGDTLFEMTPHFSFAQAREMIASGVMDVQSHTYNMHQSALFEKGDKVRETIVPLEGESDEAYAQVLLSDIEQYNDLAKQELGRPFTSLAYPQGKYTTLTEILVHEAGIPVTMSTRTDSRNVLVRGLPQSLYALSRWYMMEATTPERMLEVLTGKEEGGE